MTEAEESDLRRGCGWWIGDGLSKSQKDKILEDYRKHVKERKAKKYKPKFDI